MDNAAYRSLNRVDTLTASRALTQLEAAGLLHRSEQRRGPGVHYTLADITGASNTTSKVTPKTQAELLTLLKTEKRLTRDEVEGLIVALCMETPRTARELAEILHRNPDYVRNAYLSRLVRAGRLQTNSAPTDPNVAYQAVSGSSKQ